MNARIKFDDSVLVVLTTAPAGLGHVRVMEALRSGLSSKTRISIMGLSDPSLQFIHRLTSQSRSLKKVMEFFQENSIAEHVFSTNYRKWLRTHTNEAIKELSDTVSMSWPQPETVIVVATHFGLAHQLAAAKSALIKKLGVKLLIGVIVTDDTSQEMWAVAGVDIIFVPSNTTREALLQHLMEMGPGETVPEVLTIPYPVSLSLGESLSDQEYADRIRQLHGSHLEVIVPVSGAAVQLDYYQQIIQILTAEHVKVSVVSRKSDYTQEFLDWCKVCHGVETITDTHDADVVTAYEREYMIQVIGVEVTKPSEQAFKALYTPFQRGGSILLLSPPVGRQEKDNLAFLRRHRLIPSVDDQARLNEWCLYGNSLHITAQLLDRAHHWRGVMLPSDGIQAGVAIKRLLDAGILAAMGDFRGYLEGHDEIRSDGVREVWDFFLKTARSA